jgi:hypothetical protein
MAVVAKLNKTAVTAKDSPGFLVNRILIPLLNEAVFTLERGPRDAPKTSTRPRSSGSTTRWARSSSSDFIGLDTVLAIADVLHREFGDDKYRPRCCCATTSPRAGSAARPAAASTATTRSDGDSTMTTNYETILVHGRGPRGHASPSTAPTSSTPSTRQVVEDLSAAVAALAGAGVRAAVLTGAGDKAFVAGADIARWPRWAPSEAEAFARKGHALGEPRWRGALPHRRGGQRLRARRRDRARPRVRPHRTPATGRSSASPRWASG